MFLLASSVQLVRETILLHFVERFKFVMQFVILGLVFFCCHCKCLREFLYFLRLPLEGMKRKIIRNLRMLESQGVVTIKNDYQDIINAIAKVIYILYRYIISLHSLLELSRKGVLRYDSSDGCEVEHP